LGGLICLESSQDSTLDPCSTQRTTAGHSHGSTRIGTDRKAEVIRDIGAIRGWTRGATTERSAGLSIPIAIPPKNRTEKWRRLAILRESALLGRWAL